MRKEAQKVYDAAQKLIKEKDEQISKLIVENQQLRDVYVSAMESLKCTLTALISDAEIIKLYRMDSIKGLDEVLWHMKYNRAEPEDAKT